MSRSGTNFHSLIEKTSHFDKDERYMATSDIMKALSEDNACVDDQTEALICSAVLKQLDDKSNDVQSVAVKCLGVLVKSVHEAQISQICVRLCELVLDGPDALRDVYSIGLKTLMTNVPASMGSVLVSKLTSRLLVGSRHDKDDVKRESLDSLADLLKRFGHLMKDRHETVLAEVTPHLSSPKAAIQKRAAVCLSALSVVLHDGLLNKLIEQLLRSIDEITSKRNQSQSDERNLRVAVQTVGRVSRAVGHRLGKHLDDAIPLLLKCLGDYDNEELQSDAGNELRENCFPGLESFILRCPREVTNHVQSILSSSLLFMTFDPNYCYDDDDDESIEEEEESDDEFDDLGGSEDDDSSWKVRKAALRAVSAVIRKRHEVFENANLFIKVFNDLLDGLREREESVQIEVVCCLYQLLERTQQVSAGSKNSTRFDLSKSPHNSGAHRGGQAAINVILEFLQEKVASILRSSKKLLKGQSHKVKTATFIMLQHLVAALGSKYPMEQMESLMNMVMKCLQEEGNQSLKLECISLLMEMFKSHSSASLQEFIQGLLPQILKSVDNEWYVNVKYHRYFHVPFRYKIVAASMRLIGIVLSTSRPQCSKMEIEGEQSQLDLTPYFEDIVKAIQPRLETLDVDQEIKESSIACAGQLLAVAGDSIPPSLALNLVHVLLKRVENEVTRISALRALSHVASSPIDLGAEVSSVLSSGTVDVISPFLRQQSRIIKQSALHTLSSIMKLQSRLQGGGLTQETICDLLMQLSHLLLESDMNITELGLQVIVQVLTSCDKQVEMFDSIQEVLKHDVLPRVMDLAISPLLQGGAQSNLIELLCLFFLIPALQVPFAEVKVTLMERLDQVGACDQSDVPLQCISSLATCVAGICKKADPEDRRQCVVELLNGLDENSSSVAHNYLSMLCIGHLGQSIDVESDKQLADRLKVEVMRGFENISEDVKSATAFALGRLAVGNMSTFLPIVLKACDQENDGIKHQYLLLVALKEAIVVHVSSASNEASFLPYLDSVLPGLISLARSSSEEGVRNMVAECLGALTAVHTQKIVSLLNDSAQKERSNKHLVWTMVSSMRYFFSRAHMSSMPESEMNIQPFLTFLQDDDIDVRRACLLMVNAAVHYTPSVVLPHLEELVVPPVLEMLAFKQKREVQMGPFKHYVDDGLPLRKSALTCFETMLHIIPDTIEPNSLISSLNKVLADNLNETNLQCHQVLCKLCTVAPSAVLCAVEDFMEPIQKVVTKYEKLCTGGQGEGGPEKERASEQARSAIRVFSAINKLENVELNQVWQDFSSKLSHRASVAMILQEQEDQACEM